MSASHGFNSGTAAKEAVALLLCFAALLLISGCGKSEPETAPASQVQETDTGATVAPDPFDMSELQNAFAGSDAATRVFVQEIADTVRGRDFVFALEQLQKLSQKPGLSPEQSQAVQNALSKVQRWASSQGRR